MPQSRPAPIATPCVRVCAIEPLSSLCLGCGRTLQEIGAWSAMSPEARRTVMATLRERLARLKAARPEAFAYMGPDDEDGPDDAHAQR